jgi:hypothetical protein
VTAGAWFFVYWITWGPLFGPVAQVNHAVMVTPTREMCQAVREAVLRLPTLEEPGAGSVMAHSCQQRVASPDWLQPAMPAQPAIAGYR